MKTSGSTALLDW